MEDSIRCSSLRLFTVSDITAISLNSWTDSHGFRLEEEGREQIAMVCVLSLLGREGAVRSNSWYKCLVVSCSVANVDLFICKDIQSRNAALLWGFFLLK